MLTLRASFTNICEGSVISAAYSSQCVSAYCVEITPEVCAILLVNLALRVLKGIHSIVT